jgi:DNA-binding beta-propeller fold protein YncE
MSRAVKVRRPGTFVLAVLCVVACVALPARANAASGELPCIMDPGSEAGCPALATGLRSPRALAVSEDGKSVYVVSVANPSLAILRRDTRSGTLRSRSCIAERPPTPESAGCAQRAFGMRAPRDVAVSSDSRSVYVISGIAGYGSILHLERDKRTGGVSPAGCYRNDSDPNSDPCQTLANGLWDPTAIATSPDGNWVAVVSKRNAGANPTGASLVILKRNRNTGALSFADCATGDANSAVPGSGCSSYGPMVDPTDVAFSPDSSELAVTDDEEAESVHDSWMTSWAIDPDDGTLGRHSCVARSAASYCGVAGFPSGGFVDDSTSFKGPSALEYAPDGGSIYVTAALGDAVYRFARNTATGALTPFDALCVAESNAVGCNNTGIGLSAPSGIAIEPDGALAFVASLNDDAVTGLGLGNGAPAFLGCVENADPDGQDDCALSSSALWGASRIVASADGRSVYATAYDGDAIAAFDLRAPKTSISGPRRTSNRRPRFKIKSDEPGSTYRCGLDGAALAGCNTDYRTPHLAPGVHHLRAVATDAAGLADPTPAKKKFTVEP